MENAPRVYDIALGECFHERRIQDRALSDLPMIGLARTFTQGLTAANGIRIDIDAGHLLSTEEVCRQGEQATPASNVEKGLAAQIFDPEKIGQRLLGLRDPFIRQVAFDEGPPIAAKSYWTKSLLVPGWSCMFVSDSESPAAWAEQR